MSYLRGGIDDVSWVKMLINSAIVSGKLTVPSPCCFFLPLVHSVIGLCDHARFLISTLCQILQLQWLHCNLHISNWISVTVILTFLLAKRGRKRIHSAKLGQLKNIYPNTLPLIQWCWEISTCQVFMWMIVEIFQEHYLMEWSELSKKSRTRHYLSAVKNLTQILK